MTHHMAIIGLGGMGTAHLKIVTEHIPSIRVKGAYDVREEAARKAREAGLTAYPTLEALLGDREVSLVTIATPNDSHMDLAIRCLRAGKHVISEKPATMNAGELEKIIDVSRRTSRFYTVHQNRRRDKDFLTVAEVLERGLIGSPYFIESRVQSTRYAVYGWRGYKAHGGGMLLDWGVHMIDQALMLIRSEVVSVGAHLQRVGGREADDNSKVWLRFANGVSYMIEVSANCLIHQARWHVCCDEGTLMLNDFEANGRMARFLTDDTPQQGEDIVYPVSGPKVIQTTLPCRRSEEIALPAVAVNPGAYYRNIADALDGKGTPEVKPEEVLRVMRVIDAAFTADLKGTSVPVVI